MVSFSSGREGSCRGRSFPDRLLSRGLQVTVWGAVWMRKHPGQAGFQGWCRHCIPGQLTPAWWRPILLGLILLLAGFGWGPGPAWWGSAQEVPQAETLALPHPPTVTVVPELSGPIPAGRLWLAVQIQAPAGVQEVVFWLEDPTGQGERLVPEVGGPSEEEQTAWFEVPGVTEGTYRLTVQVVDGAGQETEAVWTFPVVGDLTVEPELAELEAGLWVREPSAQEAVDRMAQTGELWRLLERRYGWRRGTDPVRIQVSWEGTLGRLTHPLLMKALVEDQPAGFLARGVRAYEAVRGAPYWWEARGPEPGVSEAFPGGSTQPPDATVLYGAGAYAPEREAVGWTSFLAAYHRHPAADDAAYRLGRSHELLAARFAPGRSERVAHLLAAAWAYLAALELPDGDMAWDARNRLIYLLDAVARPEDLQRMTARLEGGASPEAGLVERFVRPQLGRDLAVAAQYALALRHLRAGEYEAAAQGLAAVLAALPEEGPWDPLALRTSQTQAAVERQQATAQQLAELRAGREGRGAEAAAAAYQEAALIYRDPHLFALALWHGQRAQYLAFGHLFEAAAHELDGAILAEDAAGQITYIRALALFEELLAAQPPEPWRERALFSKGMSLYHLLHYGQEVEAWRPRPALTQELVATFRTFADEYPASPWADDALLMVGVYGEEPRVLQALIERYPDGDKRPIAEALLEEKPHPGW